MFVNSKPTNMPAQRSTAGASKKRKAKGEMDDDQDYRPSHTTSNSQKRKKVENGCETTSVTIDLPTKALDDILKKGAAKASQKSIRDIISMIHSQKALIACQPKPGDYFTVRVSHAWSEEIKLFRVNKSHKLQDLVRAIGLGFGANGIALYVRTTDDPELREYSTVEDADRTLSELGLSHESQIDFTGNEKNLRNDSN